MKERDESESTAPREVRAIQVAIACSVIGASTKLVVGILTGSMSMISSAVDSLGDLLVSMVNLVVVRVSDAPPDDDHNYGHAKIEGLGAMFEGGFIFAAGVFILYEAGHKIWIGEESHDSTLGIVVMLPVLAMTIATVLYLRKVARETGSLVVKSDALHYLTDVWVNVGVLVSLVLVRLTGLPIIDPVISMLIALYMLYSSLHIVREGLAIVMDESLDKDVVDKVQAALRATPGIESFHDFKSRKGKIPHVDFHVVVRPEMTTKAVHDLFLELQAKVREIVGPSTKVLMHADPLGG
ncbi:MAG: cation diffusion facilitator family transporter [Sandaracinaceae bacterium]|nr:cation diffusion facilitator family transporter [Sandaracinaceae bacterium]